MSAITFIGAGNMAEAIARGLLRTAACQPTDLAAIDPDATRQRLFADELAIPCSAAPVPHPAANAHTVILAVKPFVAVEALRQIREHLQPAALLVSIAAGISTRLIEDTLVSPGNPTPRVIRVMPNTPMLVGKGMSALCAGTHATEQDFISAERIFSAGGRTLRVSEDLMDAVTAVSGSGPAYVFYLTECLANAGVSLGMTPQQAQLLARQTVIGAATLLEFSRDTPQELRRKVTTPKGTTQAAVETFQAGDFPGLLQRGVAAAAQRSKELGQ